MSPTWEALGPMAGPVSPNGVARYNGVDAPGGFPETVGLVRRDFLERWGNIGVRDETWYATADYQPVEKTTLTVSGTGP